MKNYEKEKVLGLLISVLIVISSITMIEVVFSPNHQQVTAAKTCETTFPKCPFEVKSILTEDGTWKSFNDNYPVGTPARAYVAVSDTAGITVVADIYGFWKGEETIYNGSIFDTVTIPGMTTSGEVGKPVLPILRKTLEIPHGVDITSEVLFGESSVIDDYRIISALPPVAPVWKLNDSQSETQHTFHAVYSSDSLYPSYNVSLGGNIEADSIIFRGRRLLELTINPVQYNPASKELTVYSKMIVKLNYSTPAQILPVRASLYSEPFEKMFESILLNYKPWNNYSSVISNPDNFVFPRTRTALSQGSIQAEYLIITTSDFLPAVEDLADWKNRKGIRTHIELVTRDSPASDIHDILHDAYYEWALAPTYVLLFGDCENVTNDYGIIHKGSLSYNEIGPIGTYFSLSTGFIGTDQTYFELEGTDYFPDVFSGRLSVDTLDQANIVVSKIIEYETSPPTNTVFYRNILSSASFEDFNLDGIEEADYEYVYAAENVTHYLDGLYTIHRNYTACYDGTDGALPLSFSGSSFCTHLQSYPWIPSEQTPTTESEQWLYLEWGAQNFSANINEGRFFIYNVDHGGSQNMKYYDYGGGPDWCDGWGGPGFNTGTVDNPNHLGYLTNDQSGEHPFIVSTGCNTGWFDGEIDQNFMDSGFDETSYESIAEEITRIEGGAIAVVGASRHSFNHPSQDLLNGIIQSFWPGYLELTNQPMYELGAALLLGKYNVFLENGIHGKSGVWEETQTTFQIFHLFGDPSLQLWTERPRNINVDHPIKIGNNRVQKFVVSVTDAHDNKPVVYAKVSIQQNSEIYVGYTNSIGQAVFEIMPTSTDSMSITVTKHNYRPYLDQIRIKASDAILVLSSYSGDNPDSITYTVWNFDTGPVYIYFVDLGVPKLSATITNGISAIGLVPSGPEAFVNVFAVQSETGPVAMKLFRRISWAPQPDPYIYCQKDPTTWVLNSGGGITWDNPSLVIKQGVATILRNELEQFTEYELQVTVHNDESTPAENTHVTISYARFGVGIINWEEIYQVDDTLFVPQNGQATKTVYWTPSLSGKTCFRIKIDQSRDLNLLNNEGQENAHVMPLYSPGEIYFLIGNPTNKSDTTYLEVRQETNQTDIWDTQIIRYSLQPEISEGFENITLRVDSPENAVVGDWRIFTVMLYRNGHLIDGISINATKMYEENGFVLDPITLIIVIGSAGVIVVLILFLSKKGSNQTNNT